MLYILPETTGDIIVLQATEVLTVDDCQSILFPEVEKVRSLQPELRVMLYLDPGFKGFGFDDLYNELGKPDRLSIVGDSQWHKSSTGEGKPVVANFGASQFLQGLHWLNESDDAEELYPFSTE